MFREQGLLQGIMLGLEDIWGRNNMVKYRVIGGSKSLSKLRFKNKNVAEFFARKERGKVKRVISKNKRSIHGMSIPRGGIWG